MADALTAFLTSVGTVLTSTLGWFTSVATAMITNPIVITIAGVSVFLLLYGKTMGLVKGIRGSKKRR